MPKKISKKGGEEISKRPSLVELEEQLKEHMKKALAEGHEFQKIKKALLEKNWPEHMIDRVFNEVKPKKEILKKILPKKIPKVKKIELKKIEIKPKIIAKPKPKKKIKSILKENKKPIQKEIKKPDIKKTEIKKIIETKKPGKKEYITDLDLVVKLVEKYGRIKISEIAAGFEVDKKRVEEWGRILEEHNLIKIRYPAIGEPEFVKKGDALLKKIKKRKISKKKKMIVSLIVILVVIVGVAALFITPPIKRGVEITKIVEKPKVLAKSFVEDAFSGTASYICSTTTDDLFAQYFIKNKDMRIESKINDKESLMIVKDGYIYTYLTLEDKWVKRVAPKTIVTPSSGKIPQISLLCEKAKIADTKFSIPENKILEI